MKIIERITVLLAEDHTMVRQGIHALLNAEDDIEVVGEASDGRQAVKLAQKLRPDVVIMDIAMPLLNGLEAARQILKLVPMTKVIILSAHSDDEYIDRVFDLGAAGYLVKQSSAEFLSKAIRYAQKGKCVFSRAISKRLRKRPLQSSTRNDKSVKIRAPRLTSRDVELLQLIAEGKANKQIAAGLRISIKTVEKHRQALMRKLDLHDTAGITRYAIATGIIENSIQVKII